jgi:probable rRNA maturation factor
MIDKPRKSQVAITLKNLQSKLPIHSEKIKKIIHKVLKNERVGKSGWINICFVNNSRIKKINAKFHKTNRSTDVLAFDLSDKNKKNNLAADILISTQAALSQAQQFKTTPDYELSLYVVHGILHILGFNDHTPAQIKLMRKKESQYVN